MNIVLEPGAAALLDELHRAGFGAYAVGGCVRDSLLGLAPHDWDLCTAARPGQVMELFGEDRCIPTGLQHGTVTVSPKRADKGDTVTITVKPDNGYELDELTVTDKDGDTVKLQSKGGNKYTFTMPGSKVTVEATFTLEKEENLPFADVAEDYWAVEEITWAYENGYMNGVSAERFAPGSTVTRQQLWMVLARLTEFNPSNMTEAQHWAVESKISDGSNPGGALTRQQMVTILYRWAQQMGYDVSGRADLSAFPDNASVAAYATEPMTWAIAEGIISGTTEGLLNPAGTATRAQFAVILYRFFENVM